MISPARNAAFAALRRIELDSAFSDEVLNSKLVASLQPLDRNLVTELVYGTLRWRQLLDYVIEQVAERTAGKIDCIALILLRMSLYQLWRMDRIPDHAAVNDAVNISKTLGLKRGITGFINGVLRCLCRTKPWETKAFPENAPPWISCSLPEWLWLRWSGRFGTEIAREYALSLNHPPRAAYRRNRGLNPDNNPPPGAEISETVPGALFFSSDADTTGYRIQDEASQLVPHLFGPLSGARVWDACAAPGGKSNILAELCEPGGWVISSDIRYRRAKRMFSSYGGITGTVRRSILVADAGQPAPFRGSFDVVLADVPCSGLGTLRRNPEIKWRFDPAEFPRLAENQARILQMASLQVRTGGLLAYSTCSTESEENEQIVERFLKERPEFRLIVPDHPAGISRWLDARGLLRTFPSVRPWDGFFAAIMVRLS